MCWNHNTSGSKRGINHFKEDQSMFYTCSGHILKLQIMFPSPEQGLTDGLLRAIKGIFKGKMRKQCPTLTAKLKINTLLILK